MQRVYKKFKILWEYTGKMVLGQCIKKARKASCEFGHGDEIRGGKNDRFPDADDEIVRKICTKECLGELEGLWKAEKGRKSAVELQNIGAIAGNEGRI
jgi:hypothetical protein